MRLNASLLQPPQTVSSASSLFSLFFALLMLLLSSRQQFSVQEKLVLALLDRYFFFSFIYIAPSLFAGFYTEEMLYA